ncbi:MAG: universal stress protein, partial [Halobacteriales archaeon]|nr:universal stress protein [Halobacteriales archaeon]
MSKQILVPLDNSSQAWDAFRHVLEEHSDAEITVLHVINPVNSVLEGKVYGGESKRSEEEAENIRTEAEEIAEAFDV